eukprot:359365-Chlamydomonas_euryale.AAC.7
MPCSRRRLGRFNHSRFERSPPHRARSAPLRTRIAVAQAARNAARRRLPGPAELWVPIPAKGPRRRRRRDRHSLPRAAGLLPPRKPMAAAAAASVSACRRRARGGHTSATPAAATAARARCPGGWRRLHS